MNEHEEFSFDLDDKTMSVLMKKAKRKNTLRTALISAGVSVLVFIGGLVGWTQINNYQLQEMRQDLGTFSEITEPNVDYLSNLYRINEGIIRTTASWQSYKVIEGIPVQWENKLFEYSLWGSFRQLNKEYEMRFEEGPTGISPAYNPQTFQREMAFYAPFLFYKQYANDLPLLVNMDGKAAEMALSFDKPYTVAEIQKMLPQGVHPRWYWVDTYESRKKNRSNVQPDSPDFADSVYGFDANPRRIEGGDGTEKNFILALETGLRLNSMHHDEFERIYNYLRGDKAKPTTADVKILGVVVTGTAQDLQKLERAPYLKASVLGVAVDLP